MKWGLTFYWWNECHSNGKLADLYKMFLFIIEFLVPSFLIYRFLSFPLFSSCLLYWNLFYNVYLTRWHLTRNINDSLPEWYDIYLNDMNMFPWTSLLVDSPLFSIVIALLKAEEFIWINLRDSNNIGARALIGWCGRVFVFCYYSMCFQQMLIICTLISSQVGDMVKYSCLPQIFFSKKWLSWTKNCQETD